MKKIIQFMSLLSILLLSSCASTDYQGQERGVEKSTETSSPFQINEDLFDNRRWNVY